MTAERVARVRALIAEEPLLVEGPSPLVDRLQRLCGAAVRALSATGAGVSLMAEGGVPGVAAASDPMSRMIEELQFTAGQGPCIDAFSTRRPVLQSDLDDDARARWPGYADTAIERGVHAVFAFPLQVGAARLGVLDLYRDEAGSMSPDSVGQALTFAEVAVTIVLDGQEVATSGEAAEGLDEALGYRSELYQAQGMVMIQLGVVLAEAMVRLRAHAYSQNRSLGVVARDVVEGRLRLDDSSGP